LEPVSLVSELIAHFNHVTSEHVVGNLVDNIPDIVRVLIEIRVYHLGNELDDSRLIPVSICMLLQQMAETPLVRRVVAVLLW
jgi:hypothetical protein